MDKPTEFYRNTRIKRGMPRSIERFILHSTINRLKNDYDIPNKAVDKHFNALRAKFAGGDSYV